MYNPRPVPDCDVVANFVNNLGSSFGVIPLPVSSILTTISSPFLSFFLLVLIRIDPCLVNLTALSRRLEIT
jgi:hypothetical protein